MRISDWSSDVCSSDLLLPAVVSAFDRQHAYPDIADYELLLDRSAEAAWIATEGNAFNHATRRVPDVAAQAEWQRASVRPIKARVEISASGRVRQPTFQAAPVFRRFRCRSTRIERTAPGPVHCILPSHTQPPTPKQGTGLHT